jgi:hypothetical protein
VQPGPKPLRSLAEPEGFRDADGQLPPAVAQANAIARNAIALADAATAHGGQFIFENPVGRDRNSQFAGIYEEMPEDSCETWCPRKRRASEVVDMLWVLKKKYNELRELLKYKARATIRGDQEASVDRKMGLSAEETFAPTMRHNTFKLLTASSVCRAARATASKGGTSSRLRIRSADARLGVVYDAHA